MSQDRADRRPARGVGDGTVRGAAGAARPHARRQRVLAAAPSGGGRAGRTNVAARRATDRGASASTRHGRLVGWWRTTTSRVGRGRSSISCSPCPHRPRGGDQALARLLTRRVAGRSTRPRGSRVCSVRSDRRVHGRNHRGSGAYSATIYLISTARPRTSPRARSSKACKASLNG